MEGIQVPYCHSQRDLLDPSVINNKFIDSVPLVSTDNPISNYYNNSTICHNAFHLRLITECIVEATKKYFSLFRWT